MVDAVWERFALEQSARTARIMRACGPPTTFRMHCILPARIGMVLPTITASPIAMGFCPRARRCSTQPAGRRKIFACSTPRTRPSTARRRASRRSSSNMSRSVMCWHFRRNRSPRRWRSRRRIPRSPRSTSYPGPLSAFRCGRVPRSIASRTVLRARLGVCSSITIGSAPIKAMNSFARARLIRL